MILIDLHRIYITDYLSLKELSYTFIVVQMKDNVVTIKGDNLLVSYYDMYEIRIQGNVKAVLYD